MRRIFLLGAVLAPVVLSGAPALAGSQDFALINRTGYQIDEVYVSEANNNQWGSDVMGKDALADGQTVNITFNAPDNACNWDLRVKYNDGSDAVWKSLNLCSISKVSLFWDQKNQVSRATTE